MVEENCNTLQQSYDGLIEIIDQVSKAIKNQ